jgi:hypothetical protein
VIHLHTTLGQQFLDVAIRQPVPQMPAHRHRDHLGGKRNPANADRVTGAGWRMPASREAHRPILPDPQSMDATVSQSKTPVTRVPSMVSVIASIGSITCLAPYARNCSRPWPGPAGRSGPSRDNRSDRWPAGPPGHPRGTVQDRTAVGTSCRSGTRCRYLPGPARNRHQSGRRPDCGPGAGSWNGCPRPFRRGLWAVPVGMVGSGGAAVAASVLVLVLVLTDFGEACRDRSDVRC